LQHYGSAWNLLAISRNESVNTLMCVLYFANDTKTIQITSQTTKGKSIRPHDFNSSISLAVSFINSLARWR